MLPNADSCCVRATSAPNGAYPLEGGGQPAATMGAKARQSYARADLRQGPASARVPATARVPLACTCEAGVLGATDDCARGEARRGEVLALPYLLPLLLFPRLPMLALPYYYPTLPPAYLREKCARCMPCMAPDDRTIAPRGIHTFGIIGPNLVEGIEERAARLALRKGVDGRGRR